MSSHATDLSVYMLRVAGERSDIRAVRPTCSYLDLRPCCRRRRDACRRASSTTLRRVVPPTRRRPPLSHVRPHPGPPVPRRKPPAGCRCPQSRRREGDQEDPRLLGTQSRTASPPRLRGRQFGSPRRPTTGKRRRTNDLTDDPTISAITGFPACVFLSVNIL